MATIAEIQCNYTRDIAKIPCGRTIGNETTQQALDREDRALRMRKQQMHREIEEVIKHEDPNFKAPPRLELSEAEKREVPRWLLRKVALRHEAETYAQEVRARKVYEREMRDKAVHDREKREGVEHHDGTHEESCRSDHHQTKKPGRDRDDYLDLPYPEYPGGARPSGRPGPHNRNHNDSHDDDYQPGREARPSRPFHHHDDDEDDLASQFALLRGSRQTSQTHGRPVHPTQRDNDSKRSATKSRSAATPSEHRPEPYSHDRPIHPAQRDDSSKRPTLKSGSVAATSKQTPESSRQGRSSQRGTPPIEASQAPRSRQKAEPSQRGKPSQQGISRIEAGRIPRTEQKKPAGPTWDNHGADSSHPW
ncbi:MAG: hypothetical protein ASARMPRED_000613 [Alectoria sarmentosa]|nr:MAG: hypothetical protein ASARMPRED_000613 [Alectoria sarmentosa]